MFGQRQTVCDERLAADWLLGRDEVGDDGAQNFEPTIVGTTHRSPPTVLVRETAPLLASYPFYVHHLLQHPPSTARRRACTSTPDGRDNAAMWD